MIDRIGEFFEDDSTERKSMNRLATFIAVIAITVTILWLLLCVAVATGADLQQYLGALTTACIILAGLGGFNYAAGRAAGAYTDVRIKQAEQGLQPTPSPIPPAGPAVSIQVGQDKGANKRSNKNAGS